MREWTSDIKDPPETDGRVGIVDRGTKYFDPVSCEQKEFVRADGSRFIGLLNGRGEPLKQGESLYILWFRVRR